MRPRVGHIQFINCLPLYYGLVKSHVLWDVDLIKGTPTELNRCLIEETLDICPISSIEYARHWREFMMVPDIAVGSDGPVTSIFLVSKFSIQALGGKRIALTNTSATSQVLLKIILRDGYGIDPICFESPPNLGAMLLEADAALLIGDPALQIHYQVPPGLYAYDLGAEWKQLTGLKMVFAVWAIRRSYAANNPAVVREVARVFIKSLRYSEQRIDQVAKDAARWEPFSAGFLQEYFMTLQYGFDAGHQAGLLEYYRRASALGYIAEIPRLDFLEV